MLAAMLILGYGPLQWSFPWSFPWGVWLLAILLELGHVSAEAGQK